MAEASNNWEFNCGRKASTNWMCIHLWLKKQSQLFTIYLNPSKENNFKSKILIVIPTFLPIHFCLTQNDSQHSPPVTIDSFLPIKEHRLWSKSRYKTQIMISRVVLKQEVTSIPVTIRYLVNLWLIMYCGPFYHLCGEMWVSSGKVNS